MKAHLKAVICPRAEFHFTALIVKWKPRDVDFAGGLKNSGRYVQTRAVIPDHNIGGVGAVKTLIGTVEKQKVRS